MLITAQQTKRSPETRDLLVPVQLVAGARNQYSLSAAVAAGSLSVPRRGRQTLTFTAWVFQPHQFSAIRLLSVRLPQRFDSYPAPRSWAA